MSERDLLGESVLRRALRLEEDERAPRVLLSELAAARPARSDAVVRLAAGACLALAGLAVAILLGGAAVNASVLAPALGAALLDDAIGLAIPAASGLAVIGLFVSPLTLVATVAATLLYVRFAERGADRVNASRA